MDLRATRVRALFFAAILLTVALGLLVPVAGAAGSGGGNLVFILDASGSMWGQVEGKAKIAIAKEVLSGLVESLPEGLNVGLVAYGHRKKGDCNDVEELVPLGVLHKEKIIKAIEKITPKGMTPITLSVQKTADKLKTLETETTIILVSDGKETCKQDPCAAVRALRESGVKFIMHVIGFDVTEEENAQLACIARAGGGQYFTAKNAGELKVAAQKVVEDTQKDAGILEVSATKSGKPFSAHVRIRRQGDAKDIASGWTRKEEPKQFKLLPGTYDVKLQDTSVPDKPIIGVEGVKIEPGATVQLTREFATEGILEVSATKSGKPFNAYVRIRRQGDERDTASGWTGDRKPKTFKLLAGVYDVTFQDTTVPDKPEKTVRGVEVKSGASTNANAQFVEEGFLDVSTTKGGRLFSAYVRIRRQGDSRDIASGWSGDKKPRQFKLLAGVYDVTFQDTTVPDKPTVLVRGVEVKSGASTNANAQFVEEGFLDVSTTKGGRLFSAYVRIRRQGDSRDIASGWSGDRKPKRFKLLPGAYDLKIKETSTKSQKEIKGVAIESGKTRTVEVTF